jgi:hypothetical protein
VTWVRAAAVELRPDEDIVVTDGGESLRYDALVLCPGIQLDWGAVAGLKGAIRRDGVCSIYDYEQVDHVSDEIRSFDGGTAIFTFPSTPIKCPGAAQKIMYLADDWWRRSGARDRSRIVFVSAGPRIFGVDKYARTLEKVVTRKEIETRFRHELLALHSTSREAVISNLETGETQTIPYDFLHGRRRRARPTSSSRAHSPGRPAGSTSIAARCNTFATQTRSHSATRAASPPRRPAPPSAAKHPFLSRTCSPTSTASRSPPATRATPPARSSPATASSSSPSSTTTASRARPSPSTSRRNAGPCTS